MIYNKVFFNLHHKEVVFPAGKVATQIVPDQEVKGNGAGLL